MSTPEQDYQAASRACQEATDALEDAYMAGDTEAIEGARQRFHEASGVYVKALSAAVKGRLPSFEELLGDPTIQVDPDSAILKSIIDYQNAKPATAGLPLLDTEAKP